MKDSIAADMATSFPPCYGLALRQKHLMFDAGYRPLNHGSYGAYPRAIRDKQRELQDLTEGRSDPFIRFQAPALLKQSRSAAARLLGLDDTELVYIPNATTGVNTVLRNLTFETGDTIVYFNTAYGACEKTILHVCETSAATSARIDLVFPVEDGELVSLFRAQVLALQQQGQRVKIAMFDTVCTFPGVRLPWEALVATCNELGVLSLVDGAHGIGHIDLSHLGTVRPDFFTSNCYKWLFTPRACGILYIPARNHRLISTTYPTSHGFSPREVRKEVQEKAEDYLGDLFAWSSTVDMSAYLCVPDALEFRSQVCGGEAAVRNYCFNLAKHGGARMAEILGTEVMDNSSQTLGQCCFAMVRLPLHFSSENSRGHAESGGAHREHNPERGPGIVKDIMHRLMNEHDAWIPGKFYNGAAWMRVSAQIYLELDDFVWAAGILKQLCEDVD